ITVVTLPAVTSSDRKALTGIGLALGDGEGEGELVGDGVVVAVGLVVGLGLVSLWAATTNSQTGRNTRNRRSRMKAGNDTRRWLVTPGAKGATRQRWARESAISDRGRSAGAASRHGPRPG